MDNDGGDFYTIERKVKMQDAAELYLKAAYFKAIGFEHLADNAFTQAEQIYIDLEQELDDYQGVKPWMKIKSPD